MSAWGHGPFQNDEAVTFLNSLSGPAESSLLETTIEAATKGEQLSLAECNRMMAAAELVAALRDGVQDGLPPDARSWVHGRPPPGEAIAEKARAAVSRLLTRSELRELWRPTHDFGAWEAQANGLLARLGGGATEAARQGPSGILGMEINGFNLMGILVFFPGLILGHFLSKTLDRNLNYWLPLCLAIVPGPLAALVVRRRLPCSIAHLPAWILGIVACGIAVAYLIADRGASRLFATKTAPILLASIVLTLLLRLFANPFRVRDEFSSRPRG